MPVVAADSARRLAKGRTMKVLVVDIGGTVRFGLRGDAFSERVESDSHALLINGFGYTQGIVDLHACDKTGAEPNADAGVFTKVA